MGQVGGKISDLNPVAETGINGYFMYKEVQLISGLFVLCCVGGIALCVLWKLPKQEPAKKDDKSQS